MRNAKAYILGFGAGSSLAGHTDSNPDVRCEPSQKGLFWDCPQRHNPMVVRPARSNGFPSASCIENSPSILIEPLLLIIIFAGIFSTDANMRA